VLCFLSFISLTVELILCCKTIYMYDGNREEKKWNKFQKYKNEKIKWKRSRRKNKDVAKGHYRTWNEVETRGVSLKQKLERNFRLIPTTLTGRRESKQGMGVGWGGRRAVSSSLTRDSTFKLLFRIIPRRNEREVTFFLLPCSIAISKLKKKTTSSFLTSVFSFYVNRNINIK
jgi:hypothetical protein